MHEVFNDDKIEPNSRTYTEACIRSQSFKIKGTVSVRKLGKLFLAKSAPASCRQALMKLNRSYPMFRIRPMADLRHRVNRAGPIKMPSDRKTPTAYAPSICAPRCAPIRRDLFPSSILFSPPSLASSLTRPDVLSPLPGQTRPLHSLTKDQVDTKIHNGQEQFSHHKNQPTAQRR